MDSTNVAVQGKRRLIVEVSDDLWSNLQAEVQGRSTSWHKATLAEVVRAMLAEKMGMAE